MRRENTNLKSDPNKFIMKKQSVLSIIFLLVVCAIATSCSKTQLTDRERKELRGDVKEVLTISFDIRVPLSKNPNADYTIPNLHLAQSGSNLMRFDREGRLASQREYLLKPDGFRYESYTAQGLRRLTLREGENGDIVWKTQFDEYGFPIEDMVDTNSSADNLFLFYLTFGLSSLLDGPPEYHGGKMSVTTDSEGRVLTADNGLHRHNYTYDAAGRVATKRTDEYSYGKWRIMESLAYTYDAAGLLRQKDGTEQGDSIRVICEYDADSRLIAEEKYKIKADTAEFYSRNSYTYEGNGTAPAIEENFYGDISYKYFNNYYIAPNGDTILTVQRTATDKLFSIETQSFEKGARYRRSLFFKADMNAEEHQRDSKGRDIAYLNEKDSTVVSISYDAEGNAQLHRDSIYSIYGQLNVSQNLDRFGRTVSYQAWKTQDNSLFYTIETGYEGEGNRNYVAHSHYDIAAYQNTYDEINRVEDGHLMQNLFIQNGDTITTDYLYNSQNDDSVHVKDGKIDTVYDYEYDNHGNWTRRNTYDAEGHYIQVDFRFIQYY